MNLPLAVDNTDDIIRLLEMSSHKHSGRDSLVVRQEMVATV